MGSKPKKPPPPPPPPAPPPPPTPTARQPVKVAKAVSKKLTFGSQFSAGTAVKRKPVATKKTQGRASLGGGTGLYG
tara:strand:+ start:3869 stop:4096 length:228 start_codon:yes stop_codon:yes gene_type:complete